MWVCVKEQIKQKYIKEKTKAGTKLLKINNRVYFGLLFLKTSFYSVVPLYTNKGGKTEETVTCTVWIEIDKLWGWLYEIN